MYKMFFKLANFQMPKRNSVAADSCFCCDEELIYCVYTFLENRLYVKIDV